MYRVNLPRHASEPCQWWTNFLCETVDLKVTFVSMNIIQQGNARDGYYLLFDSEESFLAFRLKYA